MQDKQYFYWHTLEAISESTTFENHLGLFRILCHLEAEIKIQTLVQTYINEFPKKLAANPTLTIQNYSNQCKSLVTPFLFQPPIFPCQGMAQRQLRDEIFKDWNPLYYVLEFCKQLNYAFDA